MPIRDKHEFKVSFLQVLDEDGRVDKQLEPDLSRDQLLELYRGMVLAREADQRMLRLQRQGRLGTFSPSTGQEAAACGPLLALGKADWLVPAFRELGALLMRGVPFNRVLRFWGGWEEGNVFPGVDRTLPIAVIVGSQIPHAAGLGYAVRHRGEKDTAVLTFFGDGATSEGDFHEGMNFAAVWKAPVVFICQNNQWAISTPLNKQTVSESIAQKGLAYGMPVLQVDGNDALAMYRAAKEALDRARAGDGPTFIEAITYRLMMHTTADDPSKYRAEGEVDQWERRDPLVRFRKYLGSKRLWNAQKEEQLRVEVKQYIDDQVKEYETPIDVKPDIIFDLVRGIAHELIEEQRAEFLHRLNDENEDADA
ncbi:MAG: pyruvate dehydrogenase (acetyl-transferring) E1 component subunit alpha [Acidobacteriota bacterium]|nr:MAG: pyruvate dehydrogenase (acetyl-transferring) E1 component subunit alpha [Acidobacteriota bacterium]